jgi:TolB-like protein/tetratricopeptide (TPR) repeat protein
MRQFLELVVENSLSGAAPLKETVIGVQLFGRAPDYDSGAEPIVRVEARRLRQKLQQYYERDGAVSPVVIHLPKGGYSPQFETRAVPLSGSAVAVAPPLAVTAGPAKGLGRRVVLWKAMAAICCLGALSIGVASLRPSAFSRVPPARASGSITSIAVLPLVNLSGDSAQDYLADGMTDELIGSLARIPALRVISRTSAMQYKDARKALPEIARELRVDAVVEGSLTRSGRQVRITVQLIDAKVDRHLWSEDYRRPIGDMLEVESEVARAIAAQVRLTLAASRESPVRRETEVAPSAWDAYLKGRYFWNKRTEEGLRKSVGYFKEAVTEAPGYARAWAGMADSWLLLGESWLRPNGEAFRETEKALDKALSLDDDLGEAHACRAALESNRGRWDQAEAEFRRALELSPGYATAHQWYAEGLAAHGRTEEALAEIRRARDLDPLSLTVNVQVGYILFLARRYDESIAQLRATVDLDPYFWMAHADLGHAYEQKRMYPEAIQELQKSVDLTQSASQTLWLAHAWALAGRKAEARRVRSTLEQSFAQGYIDAPPMALLDTALGEPDRALARLRTACSAQSRIVLSATPILDPLRADPRISAVLAHCGTID